MAGSRAPSSVGGTDWHAEEPEEPDKPEVEVVALHTNAEAQAGLPCGCMDKLGLDLERDCLHVLVDALKSTWVPLEVMPPVSLEHALLCA
ncbi:hypothetical protein FGB62_53g07 [Gracilaria domingensis]|nr:hypothetical protein FGB62_53g07 [Gracilaria domingensis]